MKLHFSKDKAGKKIYLGSSDNAWYSIKGWKTISIEWKKEDAVKLAKGWAFTLDEKKKTILIK